MSQHDFVIANQSGLNFRSDLNDALQAITSKCSGNTAPATTYAYMWWTDTSGSYPILKMRDSTNTSWITIGRIDRDSFGLNYFYSGSSAPATTYAFMPWVDTSATAILKIRNAANSAWITIGDVTAANLAHLPLVGGTLSGALLFSNTDYMKVPIGTTAQRPGSPANGMIRFNSDLTTFEGYKNSAWGEIGGGGYVVSANQAITAGGSITTTTTDAMQQRPVSGNGGSQSASVTPFGNSGGWKDGTEILLIGTDDTNSVILTFNDANYGLVGNFTSLELTKYKSARCSWNATLLRWILSGGN